MAAIGAAELRELLCEKLAQGLAGDGWRAVASDPAVFATFVRPIDDVFNTTAEVLVISRVPDRPPVEITNVVVGVSYEPLRRLEALLGEDPGLAALDEPVDVGRSPDWRISVTTLRDAETAAEELAAVVHEHGVAYAGRYATFDALLGEHRGDESETFGVMVPLLLAAAGRVDDASDALAHYRPHDQRDVGSYEVTLVDKLAGLLRDQAEPTRQ